jgi:hypothetical protein
LQLGRLPLMRMERQSSSARAICAQHQHAVSPAQLHERAGLYPLALQPAELIEVSGQRVGSRRCHVGTAMRTRALMRPLASFCAEGAFFLLLKLHYFCPWPTQPFLAFPWPTQPFLAFPWPTEFGRSIPASHHVSLPSGLQSSAILSPVPWPFNIRSPGPGLQHSVPLAKVRPVYPAWAGVHTGAQLPQVQPRAGTVLGL